MQSLTWSISSNSSRWTSTNLLRLSSVTCCNQVMIPGFRAFISSADLPLVRFAPLALDIHQLKLLPRFQQLRSLKCGYADDDDKKWMKELENTLASMPQL